MVPFSAPNHQFHSILLFLIVTDITMATPINFPFPHFSPPPPPPPHVNPSPPPPHVHPSPPPPHVHPPPPPHVRLPPSPSQSHHTVIIIVSVSCGGVFFLAFLAAALFCFLKKKKKKKVQETDFVQVDEPEKVKEAIVPGPHGPKAVLLEIEDDVHTDEKILKNEKYGKGLHSQSAEGNLKALEAGTAASSSSSSSDHRRPWDQEYKG